MCIREYSICGWGTESRMWYHTTNILFYIRHAPVLSWEHSLSNGFVLLLFWHIQQNSTFLEWRSALKCLPQITHIFSIAFSSSVTNFVVDLGVAGTTQAHQIVPCVSAAL